MTIHHLIPRQQRIDAERYRRVVEAIERTTPAQQWLLSVRGLAKQLNEQSTREAGPVQQTPARNS
jgi:hypothetical protein